MFHSRKKISTIDGSRQFLNKLVVGAMHARII